MNSFTFNITLFKLQACNGIWRLYELRAHLSYLCWDLWAMDGSSIECDCPQLKRVVLSIIIRRVCLASNIFFQLVCHTVHLSAQGCLHHYGLHVASFDRWTWHSKRDAGCLGKDFLIPEQKSMYVLLACLIVQFPAIVLCRQSPRATPFAS